MTLSSRRGSHGTTQTQNGLPHHNHHTHAHAHRDNGPPGVQTPLLAHKPATKPKRRRRRRRRSWAKWMAADVSSDRADLIFLLCYVITGLLDSASINTWNSFVSMQTGNTVYFAMGLAHPTASTRWIRSGVAITSFCLGSLIFSRLHAHWGPSRRWVLALSFALQLLLALLAAASVAVAPPPSADHVVPTDLVPIVLGALQSSGQAVASRAMRHPTLISVALTGIYCDLFSDAQLFARPGRSPERDRRAAAPLALMVGAVAGGLFHRFAGGMLAALGTVAALKAVIVLAWLFWPEASGACDELEP